MGGKWEGTPTFGNGGLPISDKCARDGRSSLHLGKEMAPHLRTEDNSLGILNSELPEGPPTLLYSRDYMVRNPRRNPYQPQLGKWALPPTYLAPLLQQEREPGWPSE